jgi:hypothetical protein
MFKIFDGLPMFAIVEIFGGRRLIAIHPNGATWACNYWFLSHVHLPLLVVYTENPADLGTRCKRTLWAGNIPQYNVTCKSAATKGGSSFTQTIGAALKQIGRDLMG